MFSELEHHDYPHFPGYLFGCPACEAIMDEEDEDDEEPDMDKEDDA
jgi:hypothetical protein